MLSISNQSLNNYSDISQEQNTDHKNSAQCFQKLIISYPSIFKILNFILLQEGTNRANRISQLINHFILRKINNIEIATVIYPLFLIVLYYEQ
ncbi:MAG: hypothetical protein WBJ81_00275 [Rickettsiales bacterium]